MPFPFLHRKLPTCSPTFWPYFFMYVPSPASTVNCSSSLRPLYSYPITRCPSSVDCSCTLYLRGFILPCICRLFSPQNCSSNRHLLSLLFRSPSPNFCLPEMTGCVSTYTCASSWRRPLRNITVRSSSFFQEYYLSRLLFQFLTTNEVPPVSPHCGSFLLT